MIDPKAVEAAKRLLSKEGSKNGFGRDAKAVARALLTASHARDDVVEEAATKAENHLKDWANELSITHGLYIDAKSTGRFNGRAIRQEMADIYAAQFRERSDAVYEAVEHTGKAIRSLKTGERDAG
jgi:hypothetical protein